MPKKTYTSAPADYAVCIHADCPQAPTCLHCLAYSDKQGDTYMRLINPKLCKPNGKCKFYRDSKPVVYARGFINFQKKMYPNQYQYFMTLLISQFGRNAYYERRRGETALSPKEQDIVLKALRKVGVKEEIEFDSYEENINWYD